MTTGERLALTAVWWAWADASISAALVHGAVEHWVSILEETMVQNSCAVPPRDPRNWTALASMMRRHATYLPHVKAGKYGLTQELLLGFASVFKIEAASLVPTNATWLAAATRHLCPRVRAADAMAYATFRLRHVLPAHAVEIQCLEDLLRKSAEPASILLAVASELGPVLERIDLRLRR